MFVFSILKVIVKFLDLIYSYLKISISNDMVPGEMKGREIQHSFPMTHFQVNNFLDLSYLFFMYWSKDLCMLEGKAKKVYIRINKTLLE